MWSDYYLVGQSQSSGGHNVDIDTRKLFFNAHIKPHIDYASVVWDGCSDLIKKRLNSLHRRAVKLILPDTTLTTDQRLKEMRIMSLQKLTHSLMPVCI